MSKLLVTPYDGTCAREVFVRDTYRLQWATGELCSLRRVAHCSPVQFDHISGWGRKVGLEGG